MSMWGDDMAIYEHTTEEGYDYEIYIPNNYDSNSPIISYNFATTTRDNHNSYVYNRIVDAVETQGYGNVVIFPNHLAPSTYTNQYQDMALTVVEDAKKRYNLTSDKIITTGFSSSCSHSVKTTAEYIKRNPGVSRQVAFATDGFIWRDGVLNKEEVDLLAKNDTLIVEYCQEVNKTKLSDAVINNLDMLIVTDKDQYANSSSNYWVRHDAVAINFFEGELYHEILNFLDGKGSLSTSRYNFYTNSGGKITQITEPNEFYNLLGINTYSVYKNKLGSLANYEITSGDSALDHYLNSIRGCISTSGFLNVDIGNYDGSSTTKTPSAIPQVVSEYFTSVSKILFKIADLTTDIYGVHDSYIEADKDLADIVNNQIKE